VAFGQLLRSDTFVQVQAGGGLPLDRDHPDDVFWRAVVGRSVSHSEFGRTLSPMVELVGARELTRGAHTEWDAVPQMQVTLSTRQHIMANAGVRVPLNRREGRSTQFIVYLLWDWFDGGFFKGW
jgi:hypothetical protein